MSSLLKILERKLEVLGLVDLDTEPCLLRQTRFLAKQLALKWHRASGGELVPCHFLRQLLMNAKPPGKVCQQSKARDCRQVL